MNESVIVLVKNNHEDPYCSEYGWGNGYVLLPEGHPDYDKDYNHLPYSVHGGLTFSGIMNGYWAIGFDTVHAGDNPDTCDFDYVLKETMSLKSQVDARADESSHVFLRYRY